MCARAIVCNHDGTNFGLESVLDDEIFGFTKLIMLRGELDCRHGYSMMFCRSHRTFDQ